MMSSHKREKGGVMPRTRILKRVARDLEKSLEANYFQVAIVDDSLDIIYFIFHVINPDSAYAGQTHVVQAKLIYGSGPGLRHLYPMEAPLCSFLTPMWHTNVSSQGSICLDVLRDSWSATYTFSTIIDSITNLLDDPNPHSPFNSTAGKEIEKPCDGTPAKIYTTAPEFYNKHIGDVTNMVKYLISNYKPGERASYNSSNFGNKGKK